MTGGFSPLPAMDGSRDSKSGYSGGPGLIERSQAPVPYPVGAPPSFMDRLPQLELRPEGLIAQTLLQLMPPHDHNAHQAPPVNILRIEVVRAGLVALSRHQVIPRLRPRFPAGLVCLAGVPLFIVSSISLADARISSNAGAAPKIMGVVLA